MTKQGKISKLLSPVLLKFPNVFYLNCTFLAMPFIFPNNGGDLGSESADERIWAQS